MGVVGVDIPSELNKMIRNIGLLAYWVGNSTTMVRPRMSDMVVCKSLS